MKTTLRHLFEGLRSSLWFVPGLWLVSAIAGARLFIFLDSSIQEEVEGWLPRLSAISPEGIRSLLSTIASSVLTLAGLAFSATLVALSLASGQFGPRLLRNFIRSRTNQTTFGILIGNFVFCLIVLRFVNDEFVPHFSALAAFVFAITALVAFIIFAHRIVTSLQADEVVADVYQELESAVEKFFPEALPSNEEEKKAIADRERWEQIDSRACLDSPKSGYLQAIDYESLVEVAVEMERRIRVVRRPGEFVHCGVDLIACTGEKNLDEAVKKKIFDCFLIGSVRTAEQDFEFFVRQLVEVALRALSPGINDPFTAITCIDFLSEAMSRISRRRLPHRVYHDDKGSPRVLARPITFQTMLDTSFLQIGQTGADRPDIALSLLDGLYAISRAATLDEHKKDILRHTRWIVKMALGNDSTEFDRERIEGKRDQILEACEPPGKEAQT